MTYVNYNSDKEVCDLDLNIIDAKKTTVFPAHLYDGFPIHQPYYACSRPRDTNTQYIIGVERAEHPDHFSRFGYAKSRNGYGLGHWPGRYRVSEGCCEDDQPQDMAPKQFYKDSCIGCNGGYVLHRSKAYNDSLNPDYQVPVIIPSNSGKSLRGQTI